MRRPTTLANAQGRQRAEVGGASRRRTGMRCAVLQPKRHAIGGTGRLGTAHRWLLLGYAWGARLCRRCLKLFELLNPKHLSTWFRTRPPMATTLIVPGLHGSGPGHWQTWLEKQIPNAVRVIQGDWRDAHLPSWAMRVRREIARAPGKVWIVAHSFGALAAAQAGWDHRERIAGAMLVAPADPEKFGAADLMPEGPLGFPSVLVASSNDPWMRLEKAAYWAKTWGSDLIHLGPVGHINERSGHGPWPDGLDIFDDLRASLRGCAKAYARAEYHHMGRAI